MDIRTSIVIPTLDNIPYLSNCLESIGTDLSPDDEVIVVANGTEQEAAATLGYVEGLARNVHFQLRVVYNPAKGYVSSMNYGLRLARGQYLIMGNDDVIFGRQWLSRLFAHLDAAAKLAPEIQWGYCGPSSNRALPIQNLNPKMFPSSIEPAGIFETEQQLAQATLPPIVPAQVVSGFCMLITRRCYETVRGEEDGLLDDNLPGGGFTDNDFCVRAMRAGFLGFVAPTSYVYHHGSVTMDKVIPGHKNGVENIFKFYRKYNQSRKQTLCVSYRVKIDTQEQMDLFLASLRAVRTFADCAVILNDRSKMNIEKILSGQGLSSFVSEMRTNAEKDGFNEVRDREALRQMAEGTPCDWILNLDHDEVPSKKTTYDTMQRLMNPVDPQINSYQFPIFTFWRGTDQVRVDGPWGRMAHWTMYRNLRCWGATHQLAPNTTLHCTRLPTYFPMDGVQASQLLQIEHHGYEKIEWAAEKKARYESQDIDKLEWQLGSSDGYKHLTDESKLELLPYSAKTLSVVMLAKNEWFEVIRQIRQWQTYADQVVVIDTGSIDGTDMMCEVLGVEVHRYECCPGYKDETHMLCDFAKARNFGISKATGDYIFMVDPDEELASREAYTFSKLMIRGKAGYSCEIHNYRPRPGMEPVIQRTYQPRLFENAHGVFYEARVHETLEQFFLQHPELDIDLADGILIRHYGFLKTTGEAREIKNAKYAVLLTEILKENPTDAKALFALGCQMNSVGEYDKGDELLAQAIKYEPTFVLAKWELAQRMATRALDLVKTLEGTYAPDPFFANKVKEFHHDMVKWERH